jgi:hypothetical protein
MITDTIPGIVLKGLQETIHREPKPPNPNGTNKPMTHFAPLFPERKKPLSLFIQDPVVFKIRKLKLILLPKIPFILG